MRLTVHQFILSKLTFINELFCGILASVQWILYLCKKRDENHLHIFCTRIQC